MSSERARGRCEVWEQVKIPSECSRWISPPTARARAPAPWVRSGCLPVGPSRTRLFAAESLLTLSRGERNRGGEQLHIPCGCANRVAVEHTLGVVPGVVLVLAILANFFVAVLAEEQGRGRNGRGSELRRRDHRSVRPSWPRHRALALSTRLLHFLSPTGSIAASSPLLAPTSSSVPL